MMDKIEYKQIWKVIEELYFFVAMFHPEPCLDNLTKDIFIQLKYLGERPEWQFCT